MILFSYTYYSKLCLFPALFVLCITHIFGVLRWNRFRISCNHFVEHNKSLSLYGLYGLAGVGYVFFDLIIV